MKIAFVHDEKRHTAKLPYDGAAHVEIEACPACREAPAKVAGEGVSHHDHDTYYAPARTLCCGARGELRTTVSTVFGIEEDEAVLLRGRARVY